MENMLLALIVTPVVIGAALICIMVVYSWFSCRRQEIQDKKDKQS